MISDLVVANLGWIRELAMRLCSNYTDASDLAAETICRCLVNADKYNTDKPFKPWLCAIMHNLYINECNRYARMRLTDIEECGATSNDRADQEIRVKSLIGLINDCCKHSINIECVMLYADGYTYAEIAEMLHINIGTVKSRISNGRRLLRTIIGY